MISILLVSPGKDRFSELASTLEREAEIVVSHATTGAGALALAAETTFDLVVADVATGDMTGLEFAERLVGQSPMTNCAAVSPLSGEDFHEASEGLGLIAQLPPCPGREDAQRLLRSLKEILRLTAGRGPSRGEAHEKRDPR